MGNTRSSPTFDGAIAAEIRLWHALGRGNDRRGELIAEQFRRYRGAWRQARALAFCTSILHAKFMAARSGGYGTPSMVVHGDTPTAVRTAATTRLRDREVNVLSTSDLFNEEEGAAHVERDRVPAAEGRGLRISKDKPSRLILDVVGQHRREFRFDDVLSAVTGIPRGRQHRQVEAEFPTLPAGCAIQLDRGPSGWLEPSMCGFLLRYALPVHPAASSGTAEAGGFGRQRGLHFPGALQNIAGCTTRSQA